MKRKLLLSLALFGALSASAQQPDISPLPQQAVWKEYAFSNASQYQLVGGAKADADAVSLLKRNVKIANGPKSIPITIGEVSDKALKKYIEKVPDHKEGYFLKITPKEVIIAGHDGKGTYYGVQTFLQIVRQNKVMQVEIHDWPSVENRGVIEGFYGNPWSHEDRLRQFDFYGKQKMNTYVYGPKDDPYHRKHWREPYPEDEAAKLKELVECARKNKVQFVWAVHPGGDIQWNLEDSMAVCNKLEAMYKLGVRSFAVFFDDISGEGSKGDKQAGLLNYVTDNFVRKHKDVEPLIMCPTQYNKSWAKGEYLTTLGEMMYPEIRIMWTGNSVVDMIEMNDMEWINGQIKRKAFIWLNYPVNDYCQSRLLMGKTYGNGLDINNMVSGFCANPMEYAEASKVSLYSIADYTWNMPQYDALSSWERSFTYLMPTASTAFSLFCNNNIDLGKTGHGLRREGESEDFIQMDDAEKVMYFIDMQQSANQLLADSVNHPEMIAEIKPWVESMSLLGQRGQAVWEMNAALVDGDSITFIGKYKAQAAMERKQKTLISRNYEGSIVKAKPVVSGDVITPWINDNVTNLIVEYKKQYTYGIDVFPVQNIEDGVYFIKVNGEYLTDAEASADRVGDFPVFQEKRDKTNPQRQEWLIEYEPLTGRYKITNVQDGRYLNELGSFWRDKELNPYEANWHTFVLTKQNGKWSIQCAGNAGNKFLSRNGNRIGSNDNEQFVFEIVKN